MIDFFQKIVEVLNKLCIPYMLSGSVAMSLYVLPGATRDFNFIVLLKPDFILQFVENLSEGFYCDREEIEDAVKNFGLFNIIDHASGFKADFVILKNTAFKQMEFDRKVRVNYFDTNTHVVTAEDLLISKLICIQEYQSAIQIEDIKTLKSIDTLDREYINHWVESLHLNTFALFND